MTDKEKIRKYLENVASGFSSDSQVATVIRSIILPYIDSLQEEPVTSVWHDANILPDNPDAIIIEHSEYGTSIVPASKMSRYKGAEWAYIDDILNHTYSVSKMCPRCDKEETVSEDMEKAAKVYEQTRNDLDVVSDNQMVERAFQAGAKWQRQQMMKNALKCVIAKDSQDFQSEGHTIKNGVLNMTDEELRTWLFEHPSCYNCANKGKRVASNNNHCVCKIDNEIHNYDSCCKHHSKE